jgi:phosphopantothenoylcysteine synthetase/decarboxylase
MDISPVAGVRIAPMVRPKESELGMTDVYQVERTTRTGEDEYLPNKTKAATGFEDENDEYEDLDDDSAVEDDADTERKVRPAARGQVDYFA